jgi:hypothetical protein
LCEVGDVPKPMKGGKRKQHQRQSGIHHLNLQSAKEGKLPNKEGNYATIWQA